MFWLAMSICQLMCVFLFCFQLKIFLCQLQCPLSIGDLSLPTACSCLVFDWRCSFVKRGALFQLTISICKLLCFFLLRVQLMVSHCELRCSISIDDLPLSTACSWIFLYQLQCSLSIDVLPLSTDLLLPALLFNCRSSFVNCSARFKFAIGTCQLLVPICF